VRALATKRQNNKAHIRAWDSVRMKEMVGESARAEETSTSPELSKNRPVTECVDGYGSLGLVDGAQGALIQPGWIRGCEHTLDSLPRYVGLKLT